MVTGSSPYQRLLGKDANEVKNRVTVMCHLKIKLQQRIVFWRQALFRLNLKSQLPSNEPNDFFQFVFFSDKISLIHLAMTIFFYFWFVQTISDKRSDGGYFGDKRKWKKLILSKRNNVSRNNLKCDIEINAFSWSLFVHMTILEGALIGPQTFRSTVFVKFSIIISNRLREHVPINW